MLIHEINAGTLRPSGGVDTFGSEHMVCRCLVIDFDGRLAVVDSGIGSKDIVSPTDRLGREWLDLVNPVLDEHETLAYQLAQLGYDGTSVTDIILTHEHRDHVGGVADFPDAKVHVFRSEPDEERVSAASNFDGHANSGWADNARFAAAPTQGESWRGLPTFVLDGLPHTVRYLPLPGHTADHSGVLVELDDGEVLLHTGDAVFHPNQYLGGKVPSGIAAFTEATQSDEKQRLASQEILGTISTWGDVRIITAHCPG